MPVFKTAAPSPAFPPHLRVTVLGFFACLLVIPPPLLYHRGYFYCISHTHVRNTGLPPPCCTTRFFTHEKHHRDYGFSPAGNTTMAVVIVSPPWETPP